MTYTSHHSKACTRGSISRPSASPWFYCSVHWRIRLQHSVHPINQAGAIQERGDREGSSWESGSWEERGEQVGKGGSQGSKSKNTEGRREQEFQEFNWFCKYLWWKKLILLLRNWFWFRVMVNVDVFFCLESLPMLMSFSNNCGSEEASKSSDESSEEQEQLWFDITKSMS